jgi:hypothetical protein
MLLPEAREEPLAHPDFSQAEPWFDITVARKGFQDPALGKRAGFSFYVAVRAPRSSVMERPHRPATLLLLFGIPY